MKLPTTNFSVLLSLCLLSYLSACAAQPPVITKPEIVTLKVPTLIEIPKEKLTQCDSIDIPDADSVWLDAPGQYIHVLQVLDDCNGKISDFWTWYESQAKSFFGTGQRPMKPTALRHNTDP